MGTVTTSAELIESRQGTHGEFSENSAATWDMMRVLQSQTNWPVLDDGKRHACYMIVHKLSRILAGNPNEIDHWQDIAGYAVLVADRIVSPVSTIDVENDVHAALALAWNMTREQAKKHAYELMYQRRQENENKVDEAAAQAAEAALADLDSDPVEIPEFIKKWGEPQPVEIEK